MKNSLIFLITILTLITALGCRQGGNPDEAVIPLHIQTMTPENFNKFLEENKGKVVLADMWATWCPPCRMEIPTFIDIQKTLKNEVVLMTLCSKQGSNGKDLTEKELKSFMKEKGINYPVYFLSNEFFSNPLFASDKGDYAFPTTLFFDKTGKQVEKHIGYATKGYFLKTIKNINEAK